MPGLQRGLWQAAALVVLAHAVVLGQLTALRPSMPWGQHGQSALPFQMRMIPLPVPVEAPSLLLAAAPEGRAVSMQPEPAALRPSPAEPSPSHPAPALAPAGTPSGSPVLAEAPYLTRDQLTVAPQPLTSVDVEFPRDVAGIVDLRIRVTLFIDEQGMVRRVQLDTPDIPPAFARAVSDTFARARFSPGEAAGRPVRSRVRMEIEFRAPGAGTPAPAGGLSAPANRSPLSLRAPTPP